MATDDIPANDEPVSPSAPTIASEEPVASDPGVPEAAVGDGATPGGDSMSAAGADDAPSVDDAPGAPDATIADATTQAPIRTIDAAPQDGAEPPASDPTGPTEHPSTTADAQGTDATVSAPAPDGADPASSDRDAAVAAPDLPSEPEIPARTEGVSADADAPAPAPAPAPSTVSTGDATASASVPVFSAPAATTVAAPSADADSAPTAQAALLDAATPFEPSPAASAPDTADAGMPTAAGPAAVLDPADAREPEAAPGSAAAPGAPLVDANEPAGIEALAWLAPELLDPAPETAPTSRLQQKVVPLVPTAKKRRGWVWPIATLVVLAVAYVGACALWPTGRLTPDISDSAMTVPAAEEFAIDWPADGTAALSVDGAPGGAIFPNQDVLPMASITKTVTALMIIERLGLQPGDDGPSYSFTYADSQEYWQYRINDESALDVPVDGSLTAKQMLEGIMLGSAGNYIDRLVEEIWGTQDAFVADAQTWLADNQLTGITMVDASGFNAQDTASASSLIALAQKAASNEVLIGITAEKEVDLPGAGVVTNSNPLIDDDGVIGVKTGSIWSTGTSYYNLMTVKDIEVAGQSFRLYEVVLGQPDEDGREQVSRSLLDELEQALQPTTALAAGTEVATVTTAWGATSTIVTADDVTLIPWQGVSPETEATYDVGSRDVSGHDVGSLAVTGAFDEQSVALELTDTLDGPTLGWRLTHPLELWGIAS